MVSMTARRLGLSAATLLVIGLAQFGTVAAQSKAGATRDAVVSVSGMKCEEMCAPSLQKRLGKLPDVKAVTVSAEHGRAVITFALPTQVTNKMIKKAVSDAGFTATKIDWQKPA